MSDASNREGRSRKRRRVESDEDGKPNDLTTSISPPPLRRRLETKIEAPKIMNSPFQLTHIRDLPNEANVDAVSLNDLLGDPLISECWEFNYLHDLDFLMEAFDPDVKGLVKVHVVHGFWKQEDQSRLNLKEQAVKYPNITLHSAFTEMFGTHHTKMLILLRHDDTAQVIIHTANMIPFDWTNMTQAVWKSPLLPLVNAASPPQLSTEFGSGAKFKTDLLSYLQSYNTKYKVTSLLVTQLEKYDFSEIRAALVGSVPGRHDVETDRETAFGWLALQKVLKSVPVQGDKPEIVAQVSSIASITEKLLDQTIFRALKTSKNVKESKPKFKIIFPTADEIRRSLNGYSSGSAIHTKIQSPAQQKQLQYLRPMLCHWAGDGSQHASDEKFEVLDAGRKRAAPHIKTFVRFSDSSRENIDWYLLTSANLSKQAWGEAINFNHEVRIASYEIGVLVWPELFGKNATMVPTFKTDTPSISEKETERAEEKEKGLLIGARMPYDLPLVPYTRSDEPWCATKSYNEPDWNGDVYSIMQRH